MPTVRTTTPDQRLRQLDERGQRCYGNSQRCQQTAVVALHLIEADPATGIAKPDAEPVLRRSCSKHRRALADSSSWQVLDAQPIPSREVRPQDQERALALTATIHKLRGRRFAAGDGRHTIQHVKYVGDDFRITDENGTQHTLSEVSLLPDEVTFSG